MFFSPLRTVLILLGSDVFHERPDLNKKSFRTAANGYLDYFRSSNGLDIRDECVLNLFGSDKSAQDTYTAIAKFLGDIAYIKDVFVIIVSHGERAHFERGRDDAAELRGDNVAPHNSWVALNSLPFRIAIKASNDYARSSLIYFDDLYRVIVDCSAKKSMPYRKYFIVDACSSGAILGTSGHRQAIRSFAGSYPNINEPDLPRSGSVILTANDVDHISEVYASDDDTTINMPLFSHCLIETLLNGDETGSFAAFNFVRLRDVVHARVLKFVHANPDASDFRAANNPSVIYVEELADNTKGGAKLYEVEVFPNNTIGQLLFVNSAKRFRALELAVSAAASQTETLEGTIEALQRELTFKNQRIEELEADQVVAQKQYKSNLRQLYRTLARAEKETTSNYRRVLRSLRFVCVLAFLGIVYAVFYPSINSAISRAFVSVSHVNDSP